MPIELRTGKATMPMACIPALTTRTVAQTAMAETKRSTDNTKRPRRHLSDRAVEARSTVHGISNSAGVGDHLRLLI